MYSQRRTTSPFLCMCPAGVSAQMHPEQQLACRAWQDETRDAFDRVGIHVQERSDDVKCARSTPATPATPVRRQVSCPINPIEHALCGLLRLP